MKYERIYYQTGRFLTVGLVGAAALWSAGCSTYAKQTQSLINDAETTVQQANTNQVRQLASDDLNRATGNLDSAKQSFSIGKYDAAQRQSHKAAADARQAQTRAELEARKQRVASLEQDVSTLDEQIATLEGHITDIKRQTNP